MLICDYDGRHTHYGFAVAERESSMSVRLCALCVYEVCEGVCHTWMIR